MYSLYLNAQVDQVPTTLQVVYTDHDDADLTVGLNELIESYNRRLPPSRLLVVCPCGVQQYVRTSLTGKDANGRLASTSHVAVAPYDSHGRVVEEHVIHLKAASEWSVSDRLVYCLATSAVAEIVDATKTILSAPHGYGFRKPSGREENIFVRAGNMLRNPGSISVFNFLLLRKLPTNCHVVYIDSFTILSFALGLKSLIRYFRQRTPSLIVPTIENIHSYEMSPEFRVPNELNYLIVISASTSGGLARKLVKERQADPSRIVHLLGVAHEGASLHEMCIYFRVRWPQAREGGNGRLGAVIEIGTEEFLVAQGLPRPVRITRALVDRRARGELHKKFYSSAMRFYDPRPSAGAAYSTFSLTKEPASYSSAPVRAWVEGSLVHELPASVGLLIHLDDQMSGLVAESIQHSLGHDVNVCSLGELSNLPPNASAQAVVIVAYQDPDLEGLRRANIALRNRDRMYQHYVVCYAFPTSNREHTRRKEDLRVGPRNRLFGWSEFLVLPVGASSLHESFALERSALDQDAIEKSRVALGEGLAATLSARCNPSEVSADGLFLPRISGGPLGLRLGSIFFSEQERDLPISQICVYAMVAAAMQRAREADFGEGGAGWSGFDENPFVRSVLDPSMFVRFNDGILQASLLRAARPCELDYSASDDFSRQFTAACLTVLVSCDQDVGDAALEFVYALVTGKVALRPEDREQLFEEMRHNAALQCVFELLRSGGNEVTLD